MTMARVAQWIEHRIPNAGAASSILAAGILTLTPTAIACPTPEELANDVLTRTSIPVRVDHVAYQEDLVVNGQGVSGIAVGDQVTLSTATRGYSLLEQSVVMVHEAAHIAYGDSRVKAWTAATLGMAEAAADSFAIDTQRMTRHRYWCSSVYGGATGWVFTPAYPRLTRWLRAASSAATSGSWRSHDAFLWRTRFLAAGPGAGRIQLVAAAGVAPPPRDLIEADIPSAGGLP